MEKDYMIIVKTFSKSNNAIKRSVLMKKCLLYGSL